MDRPRHHRAAHRGDLQEVGQPRHRVHGGEAPAEQGRRSTAAAVLSIFASLQWMADTVTYRSL